MRTIQNKIDVISSIILILLGIAIWVHTAQFPELKEGYPGPALFPRLVSLGFLICGSILLIQHFIQSKSKNNLDSEETPSKGNLGKLGIGVIIIALYPIIQPYTGFIIALSLVCFGIGIMFNLKIWVAAITSVGCAGIVYILFTFLLGVPL